MGTDRSVRASVRARAIRLVVAAAIVVGITGIVGRALADDAAVNAIVVKWRDDVVSPQASMLPAEQLSALTDALNAPFSLVGRTRDGAFRIELLTPLSVDAARAAINRVRMLNSILYANLGVPSTTAESGAGAAKVAVLGPPVRQMILKYADFSTTFAAVRNQPLSAARLGQLSAWAGQALSYWRAMSGGAYVIRLSLPLPVDQADALAQTLAASDPSIEYVEPDRIKRPTLVPNDPLYPQQWNYQSPPAEPAGVNLPPAWAITTGSSSIFVGVIDTGILPHPDLAGRYVGGYDMISDPLVANDNDPPTCTTPGPGSCGRDPDPSDPGDWITVQENVSGYFMGCGVGDSSWHGTHVAGTIAAASNNATGVAGINWVSQVVPVRALGKCGGYDSDIVDAIVWAVGGSVPGVPDNPNPVRVINMSLGGNSSCGVFQNAIDTALNAGAVVAVAAGNENQDASVSSPGNCNGVITVAALARNGARASYSNFGMLVEIAAPGGAGFGDANDVLSTLNDGATSPDPSGYDYVYYAGTSMATPHVAGIASLILSVNPALTPAQVLATIQTTARPFPHSRRGGCSTSGTTSCGAGIIDAGAALAAVGPQPATPTSTMVSSSENPSVLGDNVLFTATVSGASPTGSVDFTDGGTMICSGVALSGGGNNPTAQCSTSSLTLGVHSIVAGYGGDTNNTASTSSTLSQVVVSTAVSVNVALASAGAVASASSTFSSAFSASAINDGDRAGLNFGAGGVWKDATVKVFPDWVEIDFSGPQTIDHVIVYSVQDNNLNPVDPGDSLTFSKNGLTAFDVQTWNGSAWVTQGSVSGNNLVKRSVAFGAVTTAKIRVSINAVSGKRSNAYAYVTEVEAWTPGTSPPPLPGTTLASSLNPAKVNQSVTLTATVVGTNPTGTVAFTSNGSPVTGCTAVALTGSGNSRAAQCVTSFAVKSVYSIIANYGGDGSNAPSASSALSETVNAKR